MKSYRDKYLEYKTKYLLASREHVGGKPTLSQLSRLSRRFSSPVTSSEKKAAQKQQVSSWIKMHDSYAEMVTTCCTKAETTSQDSFQPSGLVIRHLMSCNNQYDKDNKISKNIKKFLNDFDPHISLYGAESGYTYFTSEKFNNNNLKLSDLVTEIHTNNNEVHYNIHASILIRTWETAFILFCGIVNKESIDDSKSIDDPNLVLNLYITPYAKEYHSEFLKEKNMGNVPNTNMKVQILRFLNFLSSEYIKSIYPKNEIRVNLKYVPHTGDQTSDQTSDQPDLIFSIKLNKKNSFKDYVKNEPPLLKLNQDTTWNNKSDTSKYNAFSFFVETKNNVGTDDSQFTVNNVAKGIPNTKHTDFDKSNLTNQTPWICQDTSKMNEWLSTYSFEGYGDNIENFNKMYTNNNGKINWDSPFMKSDLKDAIGLLKKNKNNKFFLLVAHSNIMSNFLESLIHQNK